MPSQFSKRVNDIMLGRKRFDEDESFDGLQRFDLAGQRKEQIRADFIKAVTDFREFIVNNYNARHGDGEDRASLKKKITELFSAAPEETRNELLLVTLSGIGRPVSEDRLNLSLQEIAFAIFNELQGI